MSMPQQSLSFHKAASLQGRVTVPAAKNSVLVLLAAALLADGPVRLRRIPDLSDVSASCAILEDLGRPAERKGKDLLLKPAMVQKSLLSPQWMSAMRSGIFFMAPVLARTHRVEFSPPGGCDLGNRPVDIHLAGLCSMGAQLSAQNGNTVLLAPQGLHGCDFTLRLPSVGATETLLMAAAVARGTTRLYNVAVEPEVLDLVRFLTACGAIVEQPEERMFRIEGLDRLHGCDFTPSADRIWCATLMCAVAGCTGTLEVEGIEPDLLSDFPQLLRRAGCTIQTFQHSLYMNCTGRLRSAGTVQTAPFPGFATDMAPLLGAALLRAEGPTVIWDTVFTHRFACAEGFAALGAPVQVQENTLTVGTQPGKPQPLLKGTALQAQDLRGGAALMLAALQAEGKSTLTGLNYVCRGYEDLPGTLASLGAAIE